MKRQRFDIGLLAADGILARREKIQLIDVDEVSMKQSAVDGARCA